jgi:hypothetical protein
MRQEATIVTYAEKSNLVQLPGVPPEKQIGMNEINQLKAVTTDHAQLLNTTPIVDKYTCSSETTPLIAGVTYKDLTSSDITLNSISVNVSDIVVDTNLELQVIVNTTTLNMIILVGEKITTFLLPGIEIPSGSDVSVEVLSSDILTPPVGLKLKLIGTLTVVPV